MTFYEAALEVLRRNERPLHFKKITEISIREKLLSHVGRDPAAVMVARLQQEVERGDAASIIEPRRGVFDLKADVRAKLNLEAESEEEDSSNNAKRRRRRPSQLENGKQHSETSTSTLEPVQLDKEALKHLSRTRCETIAEAAFTVLKTGAKPIHIEALAQLIFDNKVVKYHTHDPVTTVKAAILTANQTARSKGLFPTFESYSNDRWGLTEWNFGQKSLSLQKQLDKISDDLTVETKKQLALSLQELKPEAYEVVISTLLDMLGYGNVKVSRRNGNGDAFFTADLEIPPQTIRACIQVVGNHNQVIDAKIVSQLIEMLPHYSGEIGVIFHLGQIDKSAVAMLEKPEYKNVRIYDRDALIDLLTRFGIGVRTLLQPMVVLDRRFFDTLS